MNDEHEEALKYAALEAVEREIGEAATRRRPFDEGETTDKALWSELEATAKSEIRVGLDFDTRSIGDYFVRYPNLAEIKTVRGTIADSVREGLVQIVFDDAKDTIEAMHAAQFLRTSDADITVWAENGYALIRRHDEPISKYMRDALLAKVSEGSYYDLTKMEVSLEHVSDRIDAHAKYQTSRDFPSYETIARRMKECRDFVSIALDRITKENRVEAAPPAPRF